MTVELKYIAPYLPYNLKAYTVFRNGTSALPLTSEVNTYNIMNFINGDTSYKILLKPLIDSRYQFEHSDTKKHYQSFEYFIGCVKDNTVQYCDMINLLKNHYDVFGLIEKGIALDATNI